MDDTIQVVTPRDAAELEESCDLIARCFPPDYYSARDNERLLLELEPYAPLRNFLIVKDGHDDIVGVLRIVDRKMLYSDLDLSVAGMSSYAIRPDHRKSGLGRTIRETWFSDYFPRYDISLGFARRVMDGYWSRFGYMGYSSYTAIQLEEDQFEPGQEGYQLSDLTGDDIGDCREIHQRVYAGIPGALVRDEKLWDFILGVMKQRQNWDFRICRTGDGEFCGYAVFRKNTRYVLETACEREHYTGLLKAIHGSEDRDARQEMAFELSPSHGFFKYLLQYNHRYSIRKAWDGGHYLQVSSIPDYLQKLREELKRRLKDTHISDFTLNLNGFVFEWQQGELVIEQASEGLAKEVEFEELEWQKILLGTIAADSVRGFHSNQRNRSLTEVLFPVLWPQTSELDQFGI